MLKFAIPIKSSRARDSIFMIKNATLLFVLSLSIIIREFCKKNQV